jgi:hypothetical protein
MLTLTDPDAISRWSPIPFEVVDSEQERLVAGDCVRVRGWLAGRGLEFEVEVSEADDGRLRLTAYGPIRMDVSYVAVADGEWTRVHASVTVSGSGLLGRMLAQATDALLAGGALRMAVERIAGALEPALAA